MKPLRTKLLAPLLLTLAGACGGSQTYSTGPEEGRKLYEVQGCATCHRLDGGGGRLGPPLTNASQYWTRETLAAYLSDPSGPVERDARLQALKRSFNMTMPAVGSKVTEEERLLLADYVLGFIKPQ